jgi:hypothetical protein
MKKRDRERKKREKAASKREARQNKANEDAAETPIPGAVPVSQTGARRSEEKGATSSDSQNRASKPEEGVENETDGGPCSR